jgi:hypothetical protein
MDGSIIGLSTTSIVLILYGTTVKLPGTIDIYHLSLTFSYALFDVMGELWFLFRLLLSLA